MLTDQPLQPPFEDAPETAGAAIEPTETTTPSSTQTRATSPGAQGVFQCYICDEPSTEICPHCTRDTCDNHICEHCSYCSDCCACTS